MDAAEDPGAAQLCWPRTSGAPTWSDRHRSQKLSGTFDLFEDTPGGIKELEDTLPPTVQVHDIAADDDIPAAAPPAITKLEQDDHSSLLPPAKSRTPWAEVEDDDDNADFSGFNSGASFDAMDGGGHAVYDSCDGYLEYSKVFQCGSWLAHARSTLPDVFPASDVDSDAGGSLDGSPESALSTQCGPLPQMDPPSTHEDFGSLKDSTSVQAASVQHAPRLQGRLLDSRSVDAASAQHSPRFESRLKDFTTSDSTGHCPRHQVPSKDSCSTQAASAQRCAVENSCDFGLLKVSTSVKAASAQHIPRLNGRLKDYTTSDSICPLPRHQVPLNDSGSTQAAAAHTPPCAVVSTSEVGRLKDSTSAQAASAQHTPRLSRLKDYTTSDSICPLPRHQVPLKGSCSTQAAAAHTQACAVVSTSEVGRLKDSTSVQAASAQHTPRLKGLLKSSRSDDAASEQHAPRLKGRLKDFTSPTSSDTTGHTPRHQVPSKDSCSMQAASAHSQPCAVESTWDFEGYTILDLDEAGQMHKPHVPCASSELDVALAGMKVSLAQLIGTASEPTPSLEVRLARLQQYADATSQFDRWIQGLASPSPHPDIQPSDVQIAAKAKAKAKTRRRKGNGKNT